MSWITLTIADKFATPGHQVIVAKPASYFLGTRLLGTGNGYLWADAEPCIRSLVFVCPTCGEAWGRVFQPGREWLPVRRGCSLHPFLSDVGGSFIHPWRSGCPSEFPASVLSYELQLRLTQA